MENKYTLQDNYYKPFGESILNMYLETFMDLLSKVNLHDLSSLVSSMKKEPVKTNFEYKNAENHLICYQDKDLGKNCISVTEYDHNGKKGVLISDTLYSEKKFLCQSSKNNKTINIEDVSDLQLDKAVLTIKNNVLIEDTLSWDEKEHILFLLSKIGDFFYQFTEVTA